MPHFTLRHDLIAEFKASWPCHGLPDDLHSITVETDRKGDVVDIAAYEHHPDGSDELLDWHDFDGAALAALVQDAIDLGDRVDEQPTGAAPAM
jgi:hypothetical protein